MRPALCLMLAALSLAFASPGIAADATSPNDGINPRYLLMDVKGRAATNTRFPGRFQLLSFGYTASPDTSPTALVEMSEVLHGLGERAARVQALFITVDPARDLPSKLRRFVDLFDKRIIGLSGDDTLTAAVIKNYKLRVDIVRAPDAAPDDYRVDHTTGMLLLDPAGSFVRTFPVGTPVTEITSALEILIDKTPLADAP